MGVYLPFTLTED